MQDKFIGTWKMDPEQNNYEFGTAPKSGLYIIQAQEAGYLISMEWTTVEDTPMQASYSAIPDGKDYATDASSGLDCSSMTRIDERTLDSDAKKGGVVLAYARRILSEDGQTMDIFQSGKKPDGTDFTNKSVYIRQA